MRLVSLPLQLKSQFDEDDFIELVGLVHMKMIIGLGDALLHIHDYLRSKYNVYRSR